MPPPHAKVVRCQICSEAPYKYKCSACLVVYCSVACYKKHKAESCSTLPPAPPPTGETDDSLAAPPASGDVETLNTLEVSTDAAVEDDVDVDMAAPPALRDEPEPPLRALSSLLWPPEPEDGENEGDPLDRDQPKPLRRDELLAIATSTDLRALLANPLLPPLLAKVNAMPHRPKSHHTLGKEQYLQMLLGVAPPASTSGGQASRGRGARGRGGRGRGGGGRGGAHALGAGAGADDGLTEEDLRLFRNFALCVEDVLRSVGRARRGLHWEEDEVRPGEEIVLL